MVLLTSLLLLSIAAATTLDVAQKHVFAGEEFSVRYATSGPTSSHKLDLRFMDQDQVIYVPVLLSGEPFTASVNFNAPPFDGDYTVQSDEGTADVNVEAPIFELKDVKVEPGIIMPRETTRLSYTISNTGDSTLYNVKGKVSIILGAGSDYEFDSSEIELFTAMGPGETRTVTKEITAREKAEGQENIGVMVKYTFDGESHSVSESTFLSVGGVPWLEIVIILLLVVIVGRVVLARFVG